MIYTSNFARVKRLPAGIEPVGIAIGPPWHYKGRSDLRLAPTREMLSVSQREYDRRFQIILENLDAGSIADSLRKDTALLCWESPNVKCHRRLVAEWLESELGIEVTEYGFDRSEILSYADAPAKPDRPAKKAEPQPKREKDTLF